MVGFNLAWCWCGVETHVQGNQRPLIRLGLCSQEYTRHLVPTSISMQVDGHT